MDFFKNAKKSYGQLWKMFIRPRRMHYDLNDLLDYNELDENHKLNLCTFSLRTKHGDDILGYRYENETIKRDKVFIYAHTHSGSAVEATSLLDCLVSSGFDLITFDFSGNGKSSGAFVTLGSKEKDDLLAVLNYTTTELGYQDVYIWGRSMGGAAIIFMLGNWIEVQKKLKGVILDSPFANLRKLCGNIGKTRTPFPGFMVEAALSMVRGTIEEKANFDINSMNPIEFVKKIQVPAVFVVAKNDELVYPKELEEMFNLYASQKKKFILINGTHASSRKSPDQNKILANLMSLTGNPLLKERNREAEGMPILIGTKIRSVFSQGEENRENQEEIKEEEAELKDEAKEGEKDKEPRRTVELKVLEMPQGQEEEPDIEFEWDEDDENEPVIAYEFERKMGPNRDSIIIKTQTVQNREINAGFSAIKEKTKSQSSIVENDVRETRKKEKAEEIEPKNEKKKKETPIEPDHDVKTQKNKETVGAPEWETPEKLITSSLRVNNSKLFLFGHLPSHNQPMNRFSVFNHLA